MKTDFLMLFKATIVTLFLSGCAQGPVGGPMTGWGHMMGYGGGGLFMWLILVIVLAVIVYFVFSQGKRSGDSMGSERETPTEILKRRYAKGEITKEEFERMKREIES